VALIGIGLEAVLGLFGGATTAPAALKHTHNRAIILIENIIHYPSDKTPNMNVN